MTNGKRKRSARTKAIIIAVAVLYVIGVTAAAVAVDGRHVRFYMHGEAQLKVEAGEAYTDPGVYAVTAGRLFGESKQHLNVAVSGAPDGMKPGVYEVEYSARYMFRSYFAKRTVTVVDSAAPVIELNYVEGYVPTWIEGYKEEGFSAFDSVDGDLTDKVQRTELEDRVVYTVTDSSGNSATVERPLSFLQYEPEITLLGDSTVNLTAGMGGFTDPGFTATDGMGNDISSLVEVSGEVIPYRAGSYELVYSISSENGESVSAVRTVNVVPLNNPDVVSPDGKTIYLTFDDGPGPYTDRLLDILAKYNVKVTFFVTGQFPDYFNCIGRAVREGHSVGVHTYTHGWSDVYSGMDSFFRDFNAMQDVIAQQTGERTMLYRFPGGSSNTVSRSYCQGIVSEIAASLTDMGYCYYDWNVSSGDAGETNKTREITDNIIEGCASHRVSVVLQHDIKDYSVAAVEDVIVWGLNNGYTFRALDTSSPNAHHTIAN